MNVELLLSTHSSQGSLTTNLKNPNCSLDADAYQLQYLISNVEPFIRQWFEGLVLSPIHVTLTLDNDVDVDSRYIVRYAISANNELYS